MLRNLNHVHGIFSEIYKLDHPRVKYEVEYQHKGWDQYRPECRAHGAARGLVSVPTRVLIPHPSTSLEVGLVFIIPSRILINLFVIFIKQIKVEFRLYHTPFGLDHTPV